MTVKGPRSKTASRNAGIGGPLVRRHHDLFRRNLHDLAVADPCAASMLDHVAEAGRAGQAADLVMRRRDLGDLAAAADQGAFVGKQSPYVVQRFERVVSWPVRCKACR